MDTTDTCPMCGRPLVRLGVTAPLADLTDATLYLRCSGCPYATRRPTTEGPTMHARERTADARDVFRG